MDTGQSAHVVRNRALRDGEYDRRLAVRCVNGTFVGKETDGIVSYKGIPFVGKQPVGDLRWKVPVDVIEDDGVYEAYHYGKAPVQSPGDPAIANGMGEDCLYLNIWKADVPSEGKRPVIVWIFGGGFEVGGATDPQYDCHALVRENPDVVLVTISYRVSFLGFLHLSHLPDGDDYQDAQNLGILDQVMALRWVHENIEGFGGDPDNVCLWGESAGAASCTLLPLVKGSHRYFRRVIAQSGAPAQTRSPEQSIACTDRLMAELGCATVADLCRLSADELTDAWTRLYGFYQVLGIRTFPERDGVILPLEPWEAYAQGAARDIDFLQGCNRDEMNTFLGALGPDDWNVWAEGRTAEKLAQLTEEERGLVESYCADVAGEDYEATVRLFSQIMFIAPQIRLSEEQVRGGGSTYTYLFTPESADPLVKSGHAIELSLVFNHPEMDDLTGRAFDATFAKTMRRMWVKFATCGDPSLGEDESPDGRAHVWPLYDLEDRRVMVLDEEETHPAKESELGIVDWKRSYFLTNYYMP